jgi:signal transduction histidine kinase
MRHQQLLNLDRVRKELVEMLVHDLRNPLTVLLGVLDVVNLVLGDRLTDEQRQLLGNARRSGHFMRVMIGDMLDVAKLEAGKFVLKPALLDVPAMLTDTVAQTRTLAELEGLTLRIDAPGPLPMVMADRVLIERVLANLVSNAIKHTPPGGAITLSAHLNGANALEVRVHDTGEGIPPEQQRVIFEKFGQVDRDRVQRRGTGLGLTFCRMAVEAHHGRIWFESTQDSGSTFVFSLPMA